MSSSADCIVTTSLSLVTAFLLVLSAVTSSWALLLSGALSLALLIAVLSLRSLDYAQMGPRMRAVFFMPAQPEQRMPLDSVLFRLSFSNLNQGYRFWRPVGKKVT